MTNAKGSNEGITGDVDAMGDLNKFMIFVAIGVGLVLYLQVLRNRKYWIIMETGLGAISLVLLLFADKMIPHYQTTGVNPLVLYMFRLMTMAKVSQSAIVFLTRNSRDLTVVNAISITNILTRVTMIMCAIHGIMNHKTISQTALKTDIFMLSLLVVGDAFQLTKLTTKEGNLTVGNPVSLHLSFDGIVEFIMASFVFGFSDMFLRVMNPGIAPSEGQVALAQVFGCFLIGLAILSFASLCFKNNVDGINVLKSKLVLYVPAMIFGLLNFVTDSSYRGPGHTIFLLGVMNLLAFNAGYAVWNHEKQKLY